MAKIMFTVRHAFDTAPGVVWEELIDWAGHANWIPATRVDVGPGDPHAVGATFTAWTGYGPLTLEDRMRVAELAWNDAEQSGDCTVDKLGPLLSGTARFIVVPLPDGEAHLTWIEDVSLPRVPQFLAPIVGRLSGVGFKLAMITLARHMRKTAALPA